MAEKKPNQNSNKLSFKDFYTAEYRPGEDESINYRAYRRKRTDEGVGKAVDHTLAAAGELAHSVPKGVATAAGYTMGIKKGITKAYKKAKEKAEEAVDHKFGRSSAGIAYAPNPLVLKDIVKMGKEEKSTSKFMNKVYNKHGKEYYNHKDVQKHFQKHAETNESVIKPKRITQVDVDQKKRDLKVARMNNQIRSLNKESSEEWAKSQEKIKNKKRDAMLKPGEKEKIDKIRDMMKNANESVGKTPGDHSYHYLQKAKRLASADGHDYDKLPAYDRTHNKHKDYYDNKARNESKYTLDDILTILGERYVAKSIANKRKASIRMKVGKVKHKAALGKRRAMRRMATQDVLKRRSRKQEWRNAFKKLAKGKRKSAMSIAQIRSIEKKLERPVWQRIVNRKSVIGVKDKRRLEIARKKGTWKK